MSAPVLFTMTAENQFSPELEVLGNFNFSLVGTSFVGTVTIQRKFAGESVFRDIKNFTENFEGGDFESEGAAYRFGILTGNFTSGTITGRLRDTKN